MFAFFTSRASREPSPSGTACGDGLESATQQRGQALLAAMRQQSLRLAGMRKQVSDRLLDWAMGDPNFKTQLFRFVDVFPTLATPEQIHDVLLDYLDQPGVVLPAGLGWGLKAGGLMKGSLAKTITSNIQRMATTFIAGHDASAALAQLAQQWRAGVAFSVDLLGEASLSDEEANAYLDRYQRLLVTLDEVTRDWPGRPMLETDHLGAVPRANVSIKISSLSAHVKPEDFAGTIERLTARLEPLLQIASARRVLVNFDMEQFAYKDLTLALFRRCCEHSDFPAGIALQAYLRSGPDDAAALIRWAQQSGRQVTVRLIKGAYWDYEAIHAEQQGWQIPVWCEKSQTDACFESMAEQFIKAIPRTTGEGGVKLALGSHNVRSLAHAQAALAAADLPPQALEYQLLQGMADGLKAALVAQGQRVRTYMPLGDVIPGMAYLVRRLLENTSNESWLRGSSTSGISDDQLLAPPDRSSINAAREDTSQLRATWAARHELSASTPEIAVGQPFLNEPLRDFSRDEVRQAFQRAVDEVRLQEPPPLHSVEDALQAIDVARSAAPSWGARSTVERANFLRRAAALMRDQRDALSALVLAECGKPWREADADVCEAIDFCEYYARQAAATATVQRLGRYVGEQNELIQLPLGVATVISPWNFPLAICTGMTSAALVTGNATLVKPAEQTSRTAQRMCELFWQSGIPTDVLQLVPGVGETVGAALVDSPHVDLIAFTGSRAVGSQILARAGQLTANQTGWKRVICEMGGKNAVIIDATADLDEAVAGVCHSAFGYAGQKCSAASRVIVLRDQIDRFLERLVAMTRSLIIGDPRDPATDIGPVIDREAAERIGAAIEAGQKTSSLVYAGTVPAGLRPTPPHVYVAPHIFADVDSSDPLAQEEIFGPVLAVLVADTFAQALDLANQTNYKLTGAVYSRTPSHLELARRTFRVGNLYLNRGSTGALVARQPFGGFGHSGTGSKAGGANYLPHFTTPEVICENTMRRGFAPLENSGAD